MPPCGNDRALDNWHPLFTIAEVIGDDWPVRVQVAFARLTEEEQELIELEQRKSVSLRESERRAEWEAREAARLERRNRLRAFRGLAPLASLDDEEDADEVAAEFHLRSLLLFSS